MKGEGMNLVPGEVELSGIPATCSSCKVEMDCEYIYSYDNSERCWDCFTKETGKTKSDISDQLAYMFPEEKYRKDPELHKKLLSHKKFIDSNFNVSWLDNEKII